jgi:2-methylisocitrate lyase-like PEP mutase family enzyme
MMSLLTPGPLPVTAPLVLNPLMARMVEAAGFGAGYLGGGATGYQKVALEANLNLTEMRQAALDIRAVSSLPLILDGACGYGDPMHMHRTIGMTEAAGFAAIEIEDQLVPKRAHHHVGIEHMIPMELMAAKVKEAVAARRPTCCCSRWRARPSSSVPSPSGSAAR